MLTTKANMIIMKQTKIKVCFESDFINNIYFLHHSTILHVFTGEDEYEEYQDHNLHPDGRY